MIVKIHVVEGDRVKAGDILFQLDLRNFEAQLEAARAGLKLAETTCKDKEKQFSYYQRVKDTRAVSEQIYQEAHYALLEAEDQIRVAQAQVFSKRKQISNDRSSGPRSMETFFK